MSSEYQITVLQKIRLEKERQLKEQVILQQEKRKQQRIFRKRRFMAVMVLAFVFAGFIYGINLLCNNIFKSNAYKEPKQSVQMETTVSAEKGSKKKEQQDKNILTEGNIYNANIPMPKEHQEYLYKLCKKRHLNYQKTLAVIKHESSFDPNVINETNDYGYFQINLVNHEDLTNKLHTENSPLNPYVNMNWGTYMLADLYSYWGEEGFTGKRLDEVVWSSYNKGITGFRNKGDATKYISKMREAIQTIHDAF